MRFDTLYFEATRRCNLACNACMAQSNVGAVVRASRARELGTELIEERLLAPARRLGISTVAFSGGEFLLRDDHLELLERSRGLGLRSAVCTNGALATRDRLLQLRLAAGDDLVVSVGIDAIDEGNAASRGVGPDTAVEALERCASLGIRRHATITVSRRNLESLGRTLAWLAGRGIPFNRSPFSARGSGARCFSTQAIGPCEMEVIVHPHLRAHPLGYVSFTPFFLDPRVHAAVSGRAVGGSGVQEPTVGCWVGSILAVNAEGDVAPCAVLLEAVRLGNIREQALDRIVRESRLLDALLDRRRLAGRCGRCRYLSTCGGCRAMAFFGAGDLFGEDPTCFFDPVDETTKSDHEDETNRNFRKYAFAWRFAGRARREEEPE